MNMTPPPGLAASYEAQRKRAFARDIANALDTIWHMITVLDKDKRIAQEDMADLRASIDAIKTHS